MKQVLLIIDHNAEDISSFDTVKEAQEFADNSQFQEFEIFTRYMTGTRAKIDWSIEADTATNLRETKKAKPRKKFRRWSEREVETLVNSVRVGTKIPKIAEVLGRTPHACYCKLNSLK